MHNNKILGKTLTFFLFITLILTQIQIVSAQSIIIVENTVDITLDQGGSTFFPINIQNNNPSNGSNITFSHNLILTDNDGDQITITFPNNTIISSGNSSQITINLSSDLLMDFGTYSGTVIATDSTTLDSDSFTLTIDLAPSICDFGMVGSDLVIDIKEPDDGDDFKPGETIKIKVDVDNVGQNDIRTQLEAFLFNEDDNIEDTSSQTINIEDNEDETFEMELEIPLDGKDIEDGEELTIYLKAFDDDNEQSNCIQDSIPIDIELEKYDVRIVEEKTLFFPSTVACGEITTLNVELINVGEKDVEVQVTVDNSELEISETSQTFELEEFSSEEENEEIKRFDLLIPENINLGEYFFTIMASFSGNQDSFKIPLNVVACDPSLNSQTGYQVPSVDLIILNPLITLAPSQSKMAHIKLTNNLPTSSILFINLKDASEFSQESSKTVSLEAFQETNIFLPINIHEDTSSGKYTAIIEISDGTSTLSSETLTISVKETQQPSKTENFQELISKIPQPVWILMNLLLVILFFMAIRVLKK
tara:strand:- start:1130 stop:2734 length:1605 start_codon:yes stop_codon:yes gene_type:complete